MMNKMSSFCLLSSFHWLSWWRHPSCMTTIDHRFDPRCHQLSEFFILHSIAGRASISLGYEKRPYDVMGRLNSHDVIPKIELIREFANCSCTTAFAQKRTEAAGFEPSTLSMTRTSWDWRSRPLDHHGPVGLKIFKKNWFSFVNHWKKKQFQKSSNYSTIASNSSNPAVHF